MVRAKGFNDAASGIKRKGQAVGKFMGRSIQNMAEGLETFGKLAQGKVNEALVFGTKAVKAVVTKLQAKATQAFAPAAMGFEKIAPHPPRAGPQLKPF